MYPRTAPFTEEIWVSAREKGHDTKKKCRKTDRDIDSSYNDKHLLDSGAGDPVVDEECKAKCESVFEKVDLSQIICRQIKYRHESFWSKSTMRVNDICIDWNSKINSTHASQSIQNHRNDPFVVLFDGPTEAEISNTSDNNSGKHQQKTEFGLVNTSIAFRHVFCDPVANGTTGSVGDHTENPRGKTNQADLTCSKVVLRSTKYLCKGNSKYAEPGDRSTIAKSGPANRRIEEQRNRTEGNLEEI
jgi:hypothetical protein